MVNEKQKQKQKPEQELRALNLVQGDSNGFVKTNRFGSGQSGGGLVVMPLVARWIIAAVMLKITNIFNGF